MFSGNLRGISPACREMVDEGVELTVNPRMHPDPGKPELRIAAQAHGEALFTVFRCDTRMNRLARCLDIRELHIQRRSAWRGCTSTRCKGKKHGLPSGPHPLRSFRYQYCCVTLISSGAFQQVCAVQARSESRKVSLCGIRLLQNETAAACLAVARGRWDRRSSSSAPLGLAYSVRRRRPSGSFTG